jgi:hypothetical protein
MIEENAFPDKRLSDFWKLCRFMPSFRIDVNTLAMIKTSEKQHTRKTSQVYIPLKDTKLALSGIKKS